MNDMVELNVDLEDYKIHELFYFAAWLHAEEFPSAIIHWKKKLVVEAIANQLWVETKVLWMLDASEKRRLKEKMAERERENAAMEVNNKNWELLTREVKTLTQQNADILVQNEQIIKMLQKAHKKEEEMDSKN